MTIQQHASFDSSAAELNATSKLVKAWESKNAKSAAKAGGISLMALSLAACGGSSTTTTTTATDTTTTTTTTTTDAAQALAFTAGFDTLSGGSGNDTFTSTTDGHYSIDDTISGGAGTDTLILRAESAADGAVTTTGIEIVDIRTVAGGSTLDATNMTGLTTVVHSAGIGALTVNGAAAGVGLEIKNQSDTDATTLNFTSGVLTGTADTVNVALNGNSGALTLTINDATGEIDTLAITSSTANTGVTTLAGDALDATSVTFTNTAAVITAGAITSATVDASGATGATTVALGAAVVTYTGGSGNDTVDAAGTLTVADTFTGGDGTDTIILNTAPTALTGARITGFENIRIGATGLTFDTDFLATTSYQIEGHASTVITDMSNNSTVTLLGNNSTIVDLSMKTNTAADVMNLTFGNTAAATQTLAELDGANTNIDTINIASGGGGANIITAFDIDVVGVNVTGAQNFTITGLTNNAGATEELEVFDASALTGALNATFTNADNALTVTGSATAANTVVLAGFDDIYVGGAGVDTVTSAAGDDTITLGAGADVYIVAGSGTNGIAATGTSLEKDVVSDFSVADDTIDANIAFIPDDGIAAVATDYLDVSGGAATTTITGNAGIAVFEFSHSNDVLGEGVAGTFDATTATGAEIEAAVIEQITTDVAVVQEVDTFAGMFVMYDEAGNAVLVNYMDSGIAGQDTITTGDFLEFTVLTGVAQGTLTTADFI